MMKKTIFFMLCLAPMGAQALTVNGTPENPLWGYNTAEAGNAPINYTTMIIGKTPTVADENTFYAGEYVDKDSFTILSNEDVLVSGNLTINEGYSLGLKVPQTPGDLINITFGSVVANGALFVQDANEFKVTGADGVKIADGFRIDADLSDALPGTLPLNEQGDLDISFAKGISAGAQVVDIDGTVAVTGGDTVLSVAGDLTVGGFQNNGNGKVIMNAGSVAIDNGDLESGTGAGYTVVASGGTVNVAGDVYNRSNTMYIDADGAISVGGAIVNDANANMVVKGASLTVSGGDDEQNVSFVNKGNLSIDVVGETNLAHGFDLSTMQITNTFSLKTGTLNLGDGADRWLNVFSNKLNSFKLNVTNDTLAIKSSVINGLVNADSGQGPVYNTNANMEIEAKSIEIAKSESVNESVTGDVVNNGQLLKMKATDQDGAGIVIEGDVYGENGTTEIISEAELNVAGDVSNRAKMSLNGALVNLTDVSNENGDLDITSLTNKVGNIVIAGDVTNNSGTTYINSKSIVIGGTLANHSGTTTVDGSDDAGDNMKIGAIYVDGGVLDINALKGTVQVTNQTQGGGVTMTGAGTIDIVGDGAMNIDNATYNVTADGTINIGGDVTFGGATPAQGNGDVNVAADGDQVFVMTSGNGEITIGGDINATANATHTGKLVANLINVGGDVNALGTGNRLIFGGTEQNGLTVDGAISATKGAKIDIYTGATNVGSVNIDGTSALTAYGDYIAANAGAINVAGLLWFDGVSDRPTGGLIVDDTDSFELKSESGQVSVAGIDLGTGKSLTLRAENSAVNAAGAVVSAGTLDAIAKNIQMGDITNSGIMTLKAAEKVSVGDVDVTAGTVNIAANGVDQMNITMGGLDIANGAYVNIDSDTSANVIAMGDVSVGGDVAQGSRAGTLNLGANEINWAAESLAIAGNYNATMGRAVFDVANAISITGNIDVAQGAELSMTGAKIATTNLENDGVLALHADNGLDLNLITNTGDLTLDSGAGVTNVDTFAVGDSGTITLMGAGLTTTDATTGEFTTQNKMLYQNYADSIESGAVNVVSDDYVITSNKIDVAGINQVSGKMQVLASDVNISGDVTAVDWRFVKNPTDTWVNAQIDGNVSGGVDFWGLERLNIDGYYTFNNNSDLWAAVMPYDETGAENTSGQNYWSKVEITDDNKIGEITNAENGGALITVGEQFISEISGVSLDSAETRPQIGITLFNTVDTGTAIWLLHADKGINVADEFDKLRNLDVKFCNNDGSLCINYADTLRPSNPYNGTESDLPIYISERDTDGDGKADSLYVVFDPAFGGPINVFDPEDVVAGVEDATDGEITTSEAIDNLIKGQMLNKGFAEDSPIEIIPVIFDGTNFEEMANELYDRMEYYKMTGEAAPLARFSRLFQPRELEQIVGSISLNEHTNFRDFEDRMLDEFIWNRNRDLSKAWVDVDFGMFSQDVTDGKRVKGNRFSVAGGFDWQSSETMLLGISARVSNSSGDNSDAVELGYLPNQSLMGTVNVNVEDLNIGFGAYLMKILGEKTRLYGNAFLDVHMLDTSRDQNFVDHIDGSGTAFSIISEWGLMHDWLNQYIVGNMYARVGYNFGFDLTEHAAGQDYMDMYSDGYLILTPGYSLIAQKRIYPSAWFQIRPYASIGVEYDVLGAPDFVKYKFSPAHKYTKYDIELDPLWANIGGGIEFLSASGVQVGIDYRYQYNDAIQLHNIKVTGSYRF